MKILDTHHHLWDLTLRDYEWMNNVNPILKRNYLIEDLNKITSKNNISNSICIQAHHSLDETEWLLNIAEKSETILGVVGWVDLSSNILEETLDNDITRNGNALNTQIIEANTDEGVLFPYGGVRIVVRVLYEFVRGTA